MYNKFLGIGNLVREWETKYLPNGSAVSSNSMAFSNKYKKPSGEQVEDVCFLEVSIFGKLAGIATQYTKKGSKLFLEGRLKFEQWEDKNGGGKRSKHILVVSELKLLDNKDNNTNNTAPQPQQQKPYHEQYNEQYNNNAPQQQPQGYGNTPTYQDGLNQQGSFNQNIPEIDINDMG